MNRSPIQFRNCLIYAPLLIALTIASSVGAQTKVLPSNADWTRAFAAPWQDIPFTPPFVPSQGRDNALNRDPRFPLLLRSSFHQHQWFWYDNNKFTPVAELIELFIGVPGNAILDDDRYVTANGCIPHDCVDRGMLWIDTAAHPAKLIFVATGDVSSATGDKSSSTMLWVFSSSKLNWQQLPPPFLLSLHRWQNNLIEQDRKGHVAWIDQGGFLMANLVQPTGEIVVITPSVLGLEPATPGVKQ